MVTFKLSTGITTVINRSPPQHLPQGPRPRPGAGGEGGGCGGAGGGAAGAAGAAGGGESRPRCPHYQTDPQPAESQSVLGEIVLGHLVVLMLARPTSRPHCPPRWETQVRDSDQTSHQSQPVTRQAPHTPPITVWPANFVCLLLGRARLSQICQARYLET